MRVVHGIISPLLPGSGQGAYLERIAPVSFSVNHLHDFFVHGFSGLIAVSPVVARPNTILPDIEIFGVVDILVRAGLYAIDDLKRE